MSTYIFLFLLLSHIVDNFANFESEETLSFSLIRTIFISFKNNDWNRYIFLLSSILFISPLSNCDTVISHFKSFYINPLPCNIYFLSISTSEKNYGELSSPEQNEKLTGINILPWSFPINVIANSSQWRDMKITSKLIFDLSI